MGDEQTIGIGTKIYKPLENGRQYFYSECAVWCNANGAMIKDMGDYYEIVEIPKPPLPELEAYKEQRKIELNTLHEAAEKEAHVLSSLGFEIDANDRANRDVNGLLVTTAEGESVAFMDYSNQAHMVTRADLLVMQREIIENAQYLYTQKWAYRTQIEACETSEALSYLNFQFAYKSFYQEPTDTGEAGSTETDQTTDGATE